MTKPTEVSDKISVSFNTVPNKPDFITIEDDSGCVLISVSEWESVKRAIDALIFEQKGIELDSMTDEQKQARKDMIFSWIDEIK